MTILSFFREYRDEVRQNRLKRERRLSALYYVAEHREDFIGKDIAEIEVFCGLNYIYTSMDFGDWSAQWREGPVILSAYIRKDLVDGITFTDPTRQ